MEKRKRIIFDDNKLPKYLDTETLSWYLSVGITTASRIGSKSGAKRKIGRRVLFDRDVIDDYMANSEAQQEA